MQQQLIDGFRDIAIPGCFFLVGLSLYALAALVARLAFETYEEARKLAELAERERQRAEEIRIEVLGSLDARARGFAESMRLSGMDVGGLE